MPSAASARSSVDSLREQFLTVRNFTREICDPLETEDYVVQSMPDVSPTRWHLAHTTWFFETFVLKPNISGYRPGNEAFEYLFNSYYNTVGDQYPRSQRGLLTRPTVTEIWEYREAIDVALNELLRTDVSEDVAAVIRLGIEHEQQHQELMLTDIKHVLSCNPLYPTYREQDLPVSVRTNANWVQFDGGVREFGHEGDSFSFDNECPKHQALLHCQVRSLVMMSPWAEQRFISSLRRRLVRI